MTKRTPTGDDTDALAHARAICGHLDRKGDVQRVCVRDPHDNPQHNMQAATPELARSLAKRGVTGGPGIDQLGMVHPGEYHEPAEPVRADAEPAHGVWGHAFVDDDPDTLVTGNTDVLPVAPPGDVQAADPPATPGNSGETPEPSSETASSAGSGGGSGRPSDDEVLPDAAELAYYERRKQALERPGQVAASFGTSTGDVPFQAALMSVLVPAARDDEAHVLAEEMAQLGGLLATAGRIASEYHRHGRLAEPGLLVALRFQANALCVGRGLQP